MLSAVIWDGKRLTGFGWNLKRAGMIGGQESGETALDTLVVGHKHSDARMGNDESVRAPLSSARLILLGGSTGRLRKRNRKKRLPDAASTDTTQI